MITYLASSQLKPPPLLQIPLPHIIQQTSTLSTVPLFPAGDHIHALSTLHPLASNSISHTWHHLIKHSEPTCFQKCLKICGAQSTHLQYQTSCNTHFLLQKYFLYIFHIFKQTILLSVWGLSTPWGKSHVNIILRILWLILEIQQLPYFIEWADGNNHVWLSWIVSVAWLLLQFTGMIRHDVPQNLHIFLY